MGRTTGGCASVVVTVLTTRAATTTGATAGAAGAVEVCPVSSLGVTASERSRASSTWDWEYCPMMSLWSPGWPITLRVTAMTEESSTWRKGLTRGRRRSTLCSMEYPKIETLYERDEKTHRLKPELILKNPVYGIIKSWQWTEKIDGTNIRCIWRDGKLEFKGRTDNAQMHPELVKHLTETVLAEKIQETFPQGEAGEPPPSVVLYGEGYGAGIQKGGDYSPTKRFILFDVLVGDKWWLSWENTKGVAARLGLDVVPFLGDMTLEAAAAQVRVGFSSALGTAKAEGMVGRTVEALFDKKGHRLIVKLKTKDF
jgi:hypothetical protein